MTEPPVDLSLKRNLESLGKTVREHPCEKPDKPKAASPAKVVQLPLWPEAKRGVPNSILRGALFAAVQGKNRVAMNGNCWPFSRESKSVTPAGSLPNPISTYGNRRYTWRENTPLERGAILRRMPFSRLLDVQWAR